MSFARLAAPFLCALATACSSSSTPSYEAAAIDASYNGDQKTAIELARKQVARFAKPDQCSPRTNYNCGTLALAYGSLAEYQILAGDRSSGETSFGQARTALAMTARDNHASAAGVIYRGVSEAYWKSGDKARAIAVVQEGRAAGADEFLYMSSAANALMEQQRQQRVSDAGPQREDAGAKP